MTNRFLQFRAGLPAARLAFASIVALAALAGCQTVPDHADLMYYHRYYEIEAAKEIAGLQAQLEAGEISEETFDAKSEEIAENVTETATMALYRDYTLDQTGNLPPGTYRIPVR